MSNRRDRRKAAAEARAKEIVATGRAWTKVQHSMTVTKATHRGRVVYTLKGGKVR